MNFAIRYLTQYEYDAEVVDNLNALRVKPHGNGRQRCDEFSVRLTPEVRLHRHTDYFGTEVVEFEVSRPHRSLTHRRARAREHQGLARAAAIDVGGARRPQLPRGRRRVPAPDRRRCPITRRSGSCSPPPGPPRRRWRPSCSSQSSSPTGSSTGRAPPTWTRAILDLLEAGAGVCQDFVHLGLSLLRHHGIAARYVSGYLFAAGSGDGQESVEVDTHAWLEALLPLGGRGRDRIRRGSAPTPPTASWPARPTSRSATAATTPTCPRSRASTEGRPAPSSTPASR